MYTYIHFSIKQIYHKILQNFFFFFLKKKKKKKNYMKALPSSSYFLNSTTLNLEIGNSK